MARTLSPFHRPLRWALVAALAAGCTRTAPTPARDRPTAAGIPARSEGAFARTDPWLLSTDQPDTPRGNHGIFLGNGMIGLTLGAFGADGNSRCHVAGVYDPSENLTAIPLWKAPANGAPTGNTYEQVLDMKRGVLTTTVQRNDASRGTLTVFVSRADPHLAVFRAEGSAAFGALEQIAALGDFRVRVPGVAVHGIRSPGDTEQTVVLAFVRDRDSRFPDAEAARLAERAARRGFGALLKEHEDAWATRWKADIRIDGDPVAQQMVHKAMFDLIQSTRPGGDDSVPPETLSGDFYKGHVFWDADVWIFPALLAQHPDLARSILDYRFRMLPEAKRRATAAGLRGADFPWESASTGKETAPKGFSEGKHVTAGVGWAAWQYWKATGDRAWLSERGFPLIRGAADFFASRATKTATGFSIEKITGPDEMAMDISDNGYTNAMARRCLLAAGDAAKVLGSPADPRWAQVAKGLTVPFDPERKVFLKMRGDTGKRTKQADGELILWPAGHSMPPEIAASTFDFHRTRPIANGPAMTASIHALLSARLGRGSDAATDFDASFRPFVRGPFLLFSEKRSLDRCVFATGLGGLLQSVLYGFGGLESVDWEPKADRPYPLPVSWKRLEITGVRRGGKQWTVVVTPEKMRMSPG